MSEETTTEQLAAIEGQATEYTPPEGWRVLAVGERLRDGDVTVRRDGYQYPTERVGGWVGSNQRYIRPIEPQPQPEPEPQPIQVREGRWRTRSGEIKNIRPCEPLQGAYFVWPWTDGFMTYQDNGRHLAAESDNDLVEYLGPIEPQPEPVPVQVREGRWRTRGGDIRNVTPRPAGDGRKDLFPWWDAAYGGTWTSGGRYYFGEESPLDLDEYLGPIEPQAEPQPEPVQVPDSNEQIRLLKECNARQAELIADLKYERSGAMERAEVSARSSRKLTEQIEELRSEVSHVQRLLGESRQRVTQLEELVASLRTINETQEKAFNAAGKANTDLQHRLDTVAAEWATQAETSRRLQIELDAAQQVPQAIADRFEEGWNQGTARAVETVLEWLQPIRAVDNEHLANETLQHLPQIMRHLTGLAQD